MNATTRHTHTSGRTRQRMRAAAASMAAAIACALAGCSLPLPDKPQRPQPYDLGSTAAAATAATAPAASLAPLAVARLRAPAAIDGTAILYRLNYSQQGAQPRPYAHARWTMPAPQLLEQQLRAHIAATRAVVDAGRGLATAELHVDVDEFAHHFSSPSESEGTVSLRATLIAPAAGAAQRIIGQRTFTVHQHAASPDAEGGTQALRTASQAALRQITDWANGLTQTPPPH